MLERDLKARREQEEQEAVLRRRADAEKSLGEAFRQEHGRYPSSRELAEMLAQKEKEDAIATARANEAYASQQLRRMF